MNASFPPSRRDLLTATGALVVSLTHKVAGHAIAQDLLAPKSVALDDVDTFLAIDKKGIITVTPERLTRHRRPHRLYSNRRGRTRRPHGER